VLSHKLIERYPIGFIHLDELDTELPAVGPTDDTQVTVGCGPEAIVSAEGTVLSAPQCQHFQSDSPGS
jgi:hypothetical protein